MCVQGVALFGLYTNCSICHTDGPSHLERKIVKLLSDVELRQVKILLH